MPVTATIWMRSREDDGNVIPGSVQTATLFADRVEFEDGTVLSECRWNPGLPLDAMLYALDYLPMRAA